MRLDFHPSVYEEIETAFSWYESFRVGLGEDFLNNLENAFLLARTMPQAWPKTGKILRKVLLKRFPYSVLYAIREESLFIVAVMHQSRKPGYWRDRLSNE